MGPIFIEAALLLFRIGKTRRKELQMKETTGTATYLSTTTATYVADEPFSLSLFAARFYGRRPAYGGWLSCEGKTLEAELEKYVSSPTDRAFLHACLDQGSTPELFAKQAGMTPSRAERDLQKLVNAIPKTFFDTIYPTLEVYNERDRALSDYVWGTAANKIEQLTQRCNDAEAKAKSLEDRLAKAAEDSTNDENVAMLEAALREAEEELQRTKADLFEQAETADCLRADAEEAMAIAEEAEAERRAVQTQFDELVSAMELVRSAPKQPCAKETPSSDNPDLVSVMINPFDFLGRKLVKELKASGITAEQLVTCTYHQLETRLSTNRPGDTVRAVRNALNAAKIPNRLA